MIGPRGLAAKDRIGKGMALADRHRGQVHPVGHIAHGIDRRHGGLAVVIDHDLAPGPQRHPQRLQPHAARVGHPADGRQNQIKFFAGTIMCRDPDAARDLFKPGHISGGANGDAMGAHAVGHMVARLVVKAAQDLRAAIILRHLSPRPFRMQANSEAI